MTTKTSKWNQATARTIFAKLTKVANDMLDNAAAPAPEAGAEAGTAGPQEVVDAIEVIVSDLEEVQEAIPAEPTNEEPVEESTADPVTDPTAEPEPEPDPEEDPKIAKLQKELKIAQDKLEGMDKEKLAERFASLHKEPRVQQAQYDAVLSSKENSAYWQAKIEAIEQFQDNDGTASNYRPAKNMTSWVKPRSKIAKQSDRGMLSL